MKARLLILLVCLLPIFTKASDLSNELYFDTRSSSASGEPSWLDGGLGKTRYGGSYSGDTSHQIHLAEIALLSRWQVNWDIDGFVHLQYDPGQSVTTDLVEAYFTYQPAPKSAVKFQLKSGLFFPAISRENTVIAWSSPYTISSSAINSWVGEEIRALGFEFKITHSGEQGDLSVTASAFGFNDAAGTILTYRGWSIGDVKAGARSRLPLAELPAIGLDSTFVPQPYWVEPVREIDEKIGYFVALDWHSHRPLKMGMFYYNNRGVPTVVEDQQYAWGTEFLNAYIELKLPEEITLLSQYMIGSTIMGGQITGTQTWDVDIDYSAGFVLVSKKSGRYRVSLRHDWFDTDDNSNVLVDNNNENGTAYTFAVSMQLQKKNLVIAEYLVINSNRPARTGIGYAAQQQSKTFQISYRFRL